MVQTAGQDKKVIREPVDISKGGSGHRVLLAGGHQGALGTSANGPAHMSLRGAYMTTGQNKMHTGGGAGTYVSFSGNGQKKKSSLAFFQKTTKKKSEKNI